MGYLKGDERLEKDPDRRVQEALQLVFRKFLELGSVRQSLLWFLEHGLQLPVRNAQGEISWKRPSYGTLYRILTNPVYGGAYAWGKSETTTRYEDGEAHQGSRRKPREQWLALIPKAHDGYVDWEQFEQIQAAIAANIAGWEQPGAAKSGAGLLAGLLRCRRCGHKLTVRYTGRDHDVLRYSCYRGWLDNGEPRCISFGGVAVDLAVGRELLRVVQPAAIEAALMAAQEQAQYHDDVLAALERDLEAARYSARRTQKQFDGADPENRLVADELERRWNQALQRVRELETRIEQHRLCQDHRAAPTHEELADLASDLEGLWNDAQADTRLKKRIVRALIREVIVDVDAAAGEVILVIHWKGGVHSELRLPRRRRGQSSGHTSQQTVEAVRVLAQIHSDDMIAAALNRNGLRTGRGNRWTRERVTSLRTHQGIPCYCAERRSAAGWMTLTEAAKLLQLSPRTLRLAVRRGEIPAQHPLAEGPWVFTRSDLETEAARQLVARATRSNRNTAVHSEGQARLEFSST